VNHFEANLQHVKHNRRKIPKKKLFAEISHLEFTREEKGSIISYFFVQQLDKISFTYCQAQRNCPTEKVFDAWHVPTLIAILLITN